MVYVDERVKETFRIPQPEDRGKYIRLDQNENPDGIPQWLFDETVKKLSPSFLSIYPEETRLTHKYADKIGVGHDNVTLTDGSVVGMGYVIKVFGQPGKKLLSVSPTFGMYKVYAEMIGMNVSLFRYKEDYTFDVNTLLDAIDDDTGIVVLVNPNMPMGNVYTDDEVKKVVSKAKEHDALVIIDEAYHYYYDGTSVGLIREFDNVVILRTFSKMLSIPALRMGAIISCADNVRYVNNYKPHYTVNSIALLFGEAIIDNYDRILSELKEKYEKGKEYLYSELKKSGYKIIPSEGCFICIRPKHRTSEYITQELKNNGILILLGTGDLSGFLRVSICDVKYMKIFMNALKKIDVEEK